MAVGCVWIWNWVLCAGLSVGESGCGCRFSDAGEVFIGCVLL